ncbi:MAG: DNA repair protein RecN [Betaproteobacteria bacterium]|nr:DNA repair protein RecN [Betaproteobacteria bacterium]
MLRSLSIRNYVIVESLDLEFDAGLTVFTGETGAGKSILIDALSLALGGRADASAIRQGATRSEIAATFDITSNHHLNTLLHEMGLSAGEDEPICILRRLIDNQGKSRAFINGSSVTLGQLKDVAQYLINIHGQHAHQTLQLSATQRQLLDSFADNFKLIEKVSNCYRDWQDKSKQFENWQLRSATLEQDKQRIIDEIKELENVVIAPDEWVEFNEQHSRLTYALQVLNLNQQVMESLGEGADSALERIEKALSLLQEMPYEDAKLKPSIELIHSSAIQLDEALIGIRHFIHSIELDDSRLQAMDEQMAQLLHCARRFRVGPENLWQLLQTRIQELNSIELLSSGEDLEKQQKKAFDDYLHVAGLLTEKRQKAAQLLSTIITNTLKDLALGDGRFTIEIMRLDEPTMHGMDQVTFKVSTHEKQLPQDIAKVASGGELSRISLAIQAALSQTANVPTLIFDEVDTGIGGRVAEIVGRLLKELGKTFQVLCVTHLPQVASCGHHHFQVMKKTNTDEVVSRVEYLTLDQRKNEIARMLGGIEITATTLQHAQEMLDMARE